MALVNKIGAWVLAARPKTLWAAFAPVIGTRTQLEGFALGMAGITILSVPTLLLFFFLQRSFIQGRHEFAAELAVDGDGDRYQRQRGRNHQPSPP